MEGFSSDGYIFRADPPPGFGGELPDLKLANAQLSFSPEVASIVEVDVSISASAVDPIVTFLSSQLNRTCLHQ